MFYYLFSIEQEVKKPLPFNINLFKYEPISKKIYYVIQIDGETIKILDDNEQILTSGTLLKSENLQKSNKEKTDNIDNIDKFNIIKYYLNVGTLTFGGGYLNIKENNCELIIMGSGLPYIAAYKGTLRKLIKK